MVAIAPPVISRKAVTSSSLWKQNPVSSVAATVPGKARLKRETFTTTRLPTSVALNEVESGCGIVRLQCLALIGCGPTLRLNKDLFGPYGYDGNHEIGQK